MFSSKAFKFFLASLIASMIFSACNFWQTADSEETNANKFTAEELRSEIPFENKEPENFQAEIVVSTFINGEKLERITKAARSQAKIRYDFSNGISFLQTGENEKFLLQIDKKIYAQNAGGANDSATGETLKDFLTTEWLNEKRDVKFENLGAENGLAKYRISGENNSSEIIIYVDENLKFPVKQEFYSVNGEQKTLVSAIEIKNLKLEANATLFDLPKDFKKVSLEEFQKSNRKN